MTIELFTLCDFASNENGRLTIVNTLDNLTVGKLPWRAYIGFAIKGIIITEQPADTTLELSIFPKGNEDAKLFEASSPIANKTGRFAAAGNLRGLIFDNEGDYIFRIASSNGLKSDYPFNVTAKKDTNEQNND